jgi:hypothetical protein
MLSIDRSYHVFIDEIILAIEEIYPTFITDTIQVVPVSDPNRVSTFLTMLSFIGERASLTKIESYVQD